MISFSVRLAIAILVCSPLLAQVPPASPGPVAASPTLPGAIPTAAPAPVELDSLDYDEATDLFYAPGTKTPYDGPVVSTYEGGKQEVSGTLKAGQRDGRWLQYAEDGTLLSLGGYTAGKEEGEWKYWFENATLQTVGSYKDGLPDGVWKTSYESGKPESEGTYVNGQMDGDWKVFDEETGKMHIEKFKNGAQVQ